MKREKTETWRASTRWNLPVLLSFSFGLRVVGGFGTNANSINVDADVTFPDVSADSGDDSELISINNDGGIIGSLFGGTDQDESTVTISRIEGSFVASFDSNLRTNRVTMATSACPALSVFE